MSVAIADAVEAAAQPARLAPSFGVGLAAGHRAALARCVTGLAGPVALGLAANAGQITGVGNVAVRMNAIRVLHAHAAIVHRGVPLRRRDGRVAERWGAAKTPEHEGR